MLKITVAIDGLAQPDLSAGLLGFTVEESRSSLSRCTVTLDGRGPSAAVGERLLGARGRALQLNVVKGANAYVAFIGAIRAIEARFPESASAAFALLAEGARSKPGAALVSAQYGQHLLSLTATRAQATQGVGVVDGAVWLRPGDQLQLGGLGQALSGLWRVTRITRSFSLQTGLRCEFAARKGR